MLCRECKVRGACWHSGEKDWAERELDVLRARVNEPESTGVVKKRREVLVTLKEQTLAVIESWCEADRVAAEATNQQKVS